MESPPRLHGTASRPDNQIEGRHSLILCPDPGHRGARQPSIRSVTRDDMPVRRPLSVLKRRPVLVYATRPPQMSHAMATLESCSTSFVETRSHARSLSAF